jgi:Tol biopolymer transport system component
MTTTTTRRRRIWYCTEMMIVAYYIQEGDDDNDDEDEEENETWRAHDVTERREEPKIDVNGIVQMMIVAYYSLICSKYHSGAWQNFHF